MKSVHSSNGQNINFLEVELFTFTARSQLFLWYFMNTTWWILRSLPVNYLPRHASKR